MLYVCVQASVLISVSYHPLFFDTLSFQKYVYHIHLCRFHLVTHEGTLHHIPGNVDDQVFNLKTSIKFSFFSFFVVLGFLVTMSGYIFFIDLPVLSAVYLHCKSKKYFLLLVIFVVFFSHQVNWLFDFNFVLAVAGDVLLNFIKDIEY